MAAGLTASRRDRGPPADGAATRVSAVRSAQVPGADCDLGPPADGGATRPASLVGFRRLGLRGTGLGEQRGSLERVSPGTGAPLSDSDLRGGAPGRGPDRK
ncbi:hypothetical protein NDU88_002329 [Pleurodeles waltl]|uniref:Uncharacterized protein n=1 Tax=Pleurodeles waltl TaxID=8319 RepID=A0AAV7SEZ4_PLEWA|nr:hypothetical protein NDU88_002329 [Pleurodeles waltl]